MQCEKCKCHGHPHDIFPCVWCGYGRIADVLDACESDIRKHEERLDHILAQATEPREGA